MFKEAIQNIKFEENGHSSFNYASETDYCIRKTWYKRMGYKSYHNLPTEINFTQGRAIHDLFQRLFIEEIAPALGYDNAYIEVRSNSERIHGFIDVFLSNDNEIHLIELKTTAKLPDKPLSHHITQLNTYMKAYVDNQHKHGKKVRGSLYYIEKAVVYGNSPQAEFEIEYSEDLYDETTARAFTIDEAVYANVMPPAEALINKQYWECKYCYFFKPCREAGREAQEIRELVTE